MSSKKFNEASLHMYFLKEISTLATVLKKILSKQYNETVPCVSPVLAVTPRLLRHLSYVL